MIDLTRLRAATRCNRQLGKRFGDQAYAMEELVAELGAAFLRADLGITDVPREDHAQYGDMAFGPEGRQRRRSLPRRPRHPRPRGFWRICRRREPPALPIPCAASCVRVIINCKSFASSGGFSPAPRQEGPRAERPGRGFPARSGLRRPLFARNGKSCRPATSVDSTALHELKHWTSAKTRCARVRPLWRVVPSPGG